MILPDVNLLLYAYNAHVPQHTAARDWWEACLNGEELVVLPYEVSFGFVRIATNPKLGAAAIALATARDIVGVWLQQAQVRHIGPTSGHFERVMNLMTDAMATGAILSDAVLAAYAIEHRACLYSNDADFSRFRGLDWQNPVSAT